MGLLKEGERIQTPVRTVTEADISIFAGLSGDYHPAHTNEEFASKTPLKRRVAHGLLTLSISEGLFLRTNVLNWEEEPIISLGFNNVKFPNPVYPGDTIRSVFEVVNVRDSKSRPGSKVVTLRCECTKQTGEIVCEYDHVVLLLSKADQ
jgi:acyl dehydratase